MADDAEKTEEPTPKKIEDARKEGNVPKSQDTSRVITLFVAILALLMLFPFMKKHVIILFQYYFSLPIPIACVLEIDNKNKLYSVLYS